MCKFRQTPYEGEMLPYERFKLFNWVIDMKPETVFEVGTGNGGSTFFIADALKQIGDGTLITCDPKRQPSLEMLSEFYAHLDYKQITSNELIDYIIHQNIKIDYIFFDGPEDPNVALNDIKRLENIIDDGTYFSMHDWDFVPRLYDNATSIKAQLIRPYMENSENWEKIEVLSGTNINSDYVCTDEEYKSAPQLKYCDSVGLCLYKFIKNN